MAGSGTSSCPPQPLQKKKLSGRPARLNARGRPRRKFGFAQSLLPVRRLLRIQANVKSDLPVRTVKCCFGNFRRQRGAPVKTVYLLVVSVNTRNSDYRPTGPALLRLWGSVMFIMMPRLPLEFRALWRNKFVCWHRRRSDVRTTSPFCSRCGRLGRKHRTKAAVDERGSGSRARC